MITMKYNGGLGNQMFQYATAVSLANKLGCNVNFDASFFDQKYCRPYEMGIFGIEMNKSSDFRIPLYWAFRRYIKSREFFGLNIYHENQFIYENRFENIVDNTFIEGFFQSPKYFDEKLIKEKFQFRGIFKGLNKEIIEKAQSSNSVSLHIRRGDYVQKTRYKNLFNQLDIEHYKKAVNLMNSQVEGTKYFIFSDDPMWVVENLKIEGATYVMHNTGENSWMDLALMSKCKHNIIANSSFSFWGAFLNSNLNKVVIAPKIWFNEDLSSQKTNDIYPKNWYLI